MLNFLLQFYVFIRDDAKLVKNVVAPEKCIRQHDALKKLDNTVQMTPKQKLENWWWFVTVENEWKASNFVFLS